MDPEESDEDFWRRSEEDEDDEDEEEEEEEVGENEEKGGEEEESVILQDIMNGAVGQENNEEKEKDNINTSDYKFQSTDDEDRNLKQEKEVKDEDKKEKVEKKKDHQKLDHNESRNHDTFKDEGPSSTDDQRCSAMERPELISPDQVPPGQLIPLHQRSEIAEEETLARAVPSQNLSDTFVSQQLQHIQSDESGISSQINLPDITMEPGIDDNKEDKERDLPALGDSTSDCKKLKGVKTGEKEKKCEGERGHQKQDDSESRQRDIYTDEGLSPNDDQSNFAMARPEEYIAEQHDATRLQGPIDVHGVHNQQYHYDQHFEMGTGGSRTIIHAKDSTIHYHAEGSAETNTRNIVESVETVLKKIEERAETALKKIEERAETALKKIEENAETNVQNIVDNSKLLIDLNMDLFVRTSKIKKCEEQLNTWGIVTITGGSGEGKTMAGLYLLKIMSDKNSRQPLILTDPNQWDHVPTSLLKEIKFTVLIDDAFGRSNLVEDLQRRWGYKFQMMLPLIEAGMIALVIAMRSNVYKLCEENLKCIELFKRCTVIEFTTSEISESERGRLLDNHIKIYGNKLQISREDKIKIIQSSQLLAFPHCCFLFASDKQMHSRGSDVFVKPFEHLSKAISDKRRNDPLAYLVLLIVMFYDDQLPGRVLNVFECSAQDREMTETLKQACTFRAVQNVTLEALRETANCLCETYLILDKSHDIFSFSHNSIYDNVFLEFCKVHLRKGIEICSVRTLLEYVKTKKIHFDKWIVLVSQGDYHILAERLMKEIMSHCNMSVTAHPAFKDTQFIQFLLKSFWKEESLLQVFKKKTEQKQVIATLYLSDETKSFLFQKIMYQFDKSCCFETFSFTAFEYDTVISSFIMNEADSLVTRLLLSANKIEDIQLLTQVLDCMLVCAFYNNNSDLAQELLAIGAEISLACLHAICISPNTDVNLIELAFGVLQKSDVRELLLLVRLCLERGKTILDKRVIRLIWERSGTSDLYELCSYILLLSHNVTPSWIRNDQRSNSLSEEIQLLHNLGVEVSSDECILLAAGSRDVSVLTTVLEYRGNAMCRSHSEQTPLHLAAFFGSVENVQLLLPLSDALSVDDKGYTPLHCAVKSSLDSAEKVLSMLPKSDISCATKTGHTALQLAIAKGDLASIEYLYGEMKKRDIELGYPLHDSVKELSNAHDTSENIFQTAILKHKFLVVNYFQQKGHSLNDRDHENKTPLHLIVEYEKTELLKHYMNEGQPNNILEELLRHSLSCGFASMFKEILKRIKDSGTDFVSVIKTTMEYLCSEGPSDSNVQIFEYILNSQPTIQVQTTGDGYIHLVSKHGNLNLFNVILQRKSDVNVDNSAGETSLHIASSHGHLEIVKLLVQHGANVNAKSNVGDTPLHYSSRFGHTDVVKFLLELPTNVNALNNRGETPIAMAHTHGHFAVVHRLFMKGASLQEIDLDLNAGDQNSRTLLQYSSKYGHKEIVKCMLEREVDVNMANENGQTPLLLAVCFGLDEAAKYLDERGASVNMSITLKKGSPQGEAGRCHREIINYLVEKGAGINLPDKNGQSPLLVSAGFGQAELVMYLVESGANVNMSNTLGKTPLLGAVEGGYVNIIKYLVEKSAHVNIADTNGMTPLLVAACLGQTDAVKNLVEKGAFLNRSNIYGQTALQGAAEGGHTEIITYLAENGAAVNLADMKGRTPLLISVDFKRTEAVKCLIDKGADVKLCDNVGRNSLLGAAEGGNVDIINCLVENGAEVNEGGRHGQTPLLYAVHFRNDAAVKYLIRKGAKVNKSDEIGQIPLLAAAEGGNMNIIKCLIQNGANVNMDDKDGKTPLLNAAYFGHTEALQFLVGKGADVNCSAKDGRKPLTAASHTGRYAMIKCLVENGADVNLPGRDGQTPLVCAVYTRHLEVVKYLVKNGADIGLPIKGGNTPLIAAAIVGYTEAVEILIEEGAEVNMPTHLGHTPLLTACDRGHAKIVKCLVEKGAGVNMYGKDGYTPLQAAAKGGHSIIVKHLVEKGADVNLPSNNGHNALLLATSPGHMEVVQHLVEKGASVNMPNQYGDTPLLYASECGHVGIVKYLVEKSAGVNTPNNIGFTPLLGAAKEGHTEILKYLVRKGANVNMPSKHGHTPLLLATRSGNYEAVEYLVEKGADVNIPNNIGETTVHGAAEGGHTEIIKYLIEQGAGVNMTDKDGQTPLLVAVDSGHTTTVKYLIEKGANVNSYDKLGNTPFLSALKISNTEIVKCLAENGAALNLPDINGKTPLSLAVELGSTEIVRYLTAKSSHVNNCDNN